MWSIYNADTKRQVPSSSLLGRKDTSMAVVSKQAPRQSLTVVDNRTNKVYEIPIKNNAIQATDFKKIKDQQGSDRKEDETEQGLRLYDPAYMNTAVVQSKITYINGQEGILRYRGYPIEQLVKKSNFLETAFLLIYGELPTTSQYESWQNEVMHHNYIHSDIEGMFKSFRYDSHPMSMLTSAFATMGAFAPRGQPLTCWTEALYQRSIRRYCLVANTRQADSPYHWKGAHPGRRILPNATRPAFQPARTGLVLHWQLSVPPRSPFRY
ncbi:hypothetical protein NPX13_g8719 [Xylaria arbuscula]|uniref:Citrate synthase n=1 Tax=Xylaria arbuscula TaxID=114810 RepID=A0A9W8TJW3_9PEZI|nr:hypothetical protein NPX13_g8719 [Xylaria arbuscula]